MVIKPLSHGLDPHWVSGDGSLTDLATDHSYCPVIPSPSRHQAVDFHNT